MSRNIVVFDQHPVFLDYINKALDIQLDPTTARTISHVRVNDDGTHTILAVIACNNWMARSVEMSIVGSKGLWATRTYFQAVYEYIFTFAGMERIHMLVEPSNTDAVEMHKRIGHKFEGELEDWFGEDRPAHVYGLTKRNYLKGKWSPKQKENAQVA